MFQFCPDCTHRLPTDRDPDDDENQWQHSGPCTPRDRTRNDRFCGIILIYQTFDPLSDSMGFDDLFSRRASSAVRPSGEEEIIAIPLPFPVFPNIFEANAYPAASAIWFSERFGHDRRDGCPRTAAHDLNQRDQAEIQQKEQPQSREYDGEGQQCPDRMAFFPQIAVFPQSRHFTVFPKE